MDYAKLGNTGLDVSKILQLESAVEAVPVKLNPEEMNYLEEPYVPHGIVGHQ
jgi:aryl-alcohol dehydrogenase-like predicted oxidoreductase